MKLPMEVLETFFLDSVHIGTALFVCHGCTDITSYVCGAGLRGALGDVREVDLVQMMRTSSSEKFDL